MFKVINKLTPQSRIALEKIILYKMFEKMNSIHKYYFHKVTRCLIAIMLFSYSMVYLSAYCTEGSGFESRGNK